MDGLCSSVGAIEEFTAQPCFEALDITVLPGRAEFDEGGLGPDRRNPSVHGFGNELWTVVRPDVGWRTTHDEQVRPHVDHIDRG